MRQQRLQARIVFEMIGEPVALHANARFPAGAALFGLITPFQEMKQEDGQAADQLALFGPSKALDFLRDMFDVGSSEIAGAK